MENKTIDLTLNLSPDFIASAKENEEKARSGHLGTHLDIMGKKLPADFGYFSGIAFDVSGITDEIGVGDVDLTLVKKDTAVAFYSGIQSRYLYGTKEYFTLHPYLSYRLIDALIEKGVKLICVDFAGLRRGKEHTPTDQMLADKNIFVIENLCSLEKVLSCARYAVFETEIDTDESGDFTGIPCRIRAKI